MYVAHGTSVPEYANKIRVFLDLYCLSQHHRIIIYHPEMRSFVKVKVCPDDNKRRCRAIDTG